MDKILVDTDEDEEEIIIQEGEVGRYRWLTPEQYHVMREKGTEMPFSGKYWNLFKKGFYYCAYCEIGLFTSDAKFDSETGWPAFTEPIDGEYLEFREDTDYGLVRTEVLCRRCSSHLGYVFNDGPQPAGKRYCVNSAALGFEAA